MHPSSGSTSSSFSRSAAKIYKFLVFTISFLGLSPVYHLFTSRFINQAFTYATAHMQYILTTIIESEFYKFWEKLLPTDVLKLCINA